MFFIEAGCVVIVPIFKLVLGQSHICDGCCHFWSLGGRPSFLLFDVDE